MVSLRSKILAGAAAAATLASLGTVLAGPPKGKPARAGADLAPPGPPQLRPDERIDAEVRPAEGADPETSKLKIELKGFAPNTDVTLWGDDPGTPADPALVEFASATTDARGNAKLEFDTKKGDTLPFGAALAALGGLAVEVRDGAGVVLAGLFPVPVAPPPKPESPRGRSELAPPSPASPGVKGRVEVRERAAHGPHGASSSLKIHVQRLDGSAQYTLWGDDPATPADPALVQFGTLATNPGGHGDFRVETSKGGSLPFDAALGDLGGQALEVRSEGGAVALLGVFPEPVSKEPHAEPLRGRSDLDPPGGDLPPPPDGRIDAELKPARGSHAASSKLRIQVRHLAGGATFTLWADDPSTPADPALVEFASVTTRPDGNADLRYDTAKGDTLPFGATLADLGGRNVEVRDAGAAVVLAGQFPTLP